MNATSWITATPPTPNGDLHVGHLAGPYIAGDVLRRFLTADGRPAHYTSGLDDHQSYVPVRGFKDGRRAAEDVADTYGASITDVWSRAGVEFDALSRPRRDAGYAEHVQEFVRGLHDRGHLVARTRPLPWCGSCERWLYEAYVSGGCPHCGSSSNGNACEPCGRPNDCADLTDPSCVPCGRPAVLRACERLYFPLAPFADRLAAFWQRVAMPPHLRALCETMLADGLPEIAVSHPGDWGLPTTVPGFERQRIYVWFEMGPGYLWQHGLLGFDPQGPTDHLGTPESRGPVQFFGFDNGYFHALLFPAQFLAHPSRPPLPRAFVVNEFYRLEGLKFSTSRRHAIWAHDELVRTPADVLRFHVLADRPEGRQTSFSTGDLARTRQHLSDRWDGWLGRLFDEVTKDCDSRVPDRAPAGPAWEQLRERLTRTATDLREAYGVTGFAPRRATALLNEAVACAHDFQHVHAHERGRPGGEGAHRAALAAQLAVASALGAWAAPVMPHAAARLSEALGVAVGRPVDAEALRPLPAGAPLGPLTGPVFGG
ncbi:class I tRNA ligase family protein [Streptomyces lonarensis]|uniref:methionine--tRNA ligase n=1 Tax=Streptomyces lonarensis TaxID=700599 RepID=A0A7X6CY82_9ACTN|nr:class I tRNA ligase family protein [Streptomyces lonarensis]NJQ04670.1 class I tRNA ligase family protein [Streptomyces lonarensis]